MKHTTSGHLNWLDEHPSFILLLSHSSGTSGKSESIQTTYNKTVFFEENNVVTESKFPKRDEMPQPQL